ncbi:MAG: aminoglycoside phosphotransferase family protein [Paracoccaceae bacterium]
MALSGGRTNVIWRVGNGQAALVCKLYAHSAESPLFPNDSEAEALALTALSGTHLAPEMIGRYATSLGPCLLYRYVEGASFSGDITLAAGALKHLHCQLPPAGLRHIEQGPAALRRQGFEILDACTSSVAQTLRAVCPNVRDIEQSETVFLHGDAVPANMIQGPNGTVLIDWQCPALGDPAEDLATFLSPAMQSLYGGRPLTVDEQAGFLSAYGNRYTVRSYRVLRPLFHWRMAAHCLWKSERGAPDYADAMQLELAQLEQL